MSQHFYDVDDDDDEKKFVDLEMQMTPSYHKSNSSIIPDSPNDNDDNVSELERELSNRDKSRPVPIALDKYESGSAGTYHITHSGARSRLNDSIDKIASTKVVRPGVLDELWDHLEGI